MAPILAKGPNGMLSHIPDRRLAQRVDAKLKLAVKLPLSDGSEEAASLETVNISSSGIYFKSSSYIEPMTKLDMGLELSVPSTTKPKQAGIATVKCQGIVVRVTPEDGEPEDGEWEVAVFFTYIDSSGLQALEKHINYLLETVQ
jgi:hypothetical protein